MTIKELRKEKGLSQAAFAESIGVKTPTIGAYENGRINPSAAVLARISEVYGVNLTAPASKEEAKEAAPKKRAAGKKKEAAAEKKPQTKRAARKKKDEQAAPAAEKKAEAEKSSPKKRAAGKKAAPAPAVEEKPKQKRGRKKEAAVSMPKLVIQSPMGGSITSEEIIAKIGSADTVYIRVDENKAYWVNGEETGSVDLW